MKKKWLIGFLVCLMTIAMAFGISACGINKNDEPPAGSDADVAKSMVAQLKELYKNVNDNDSSYEVLGQVKAPDGTTTYSVVWTAVAKTPNININDYVAIGEMNATSKIIKITLTMGNEPIEFALKASVTVGTATESIEFTHKLNAKPADAKGTADDPFSTRKVIEIANSLTGTPPVYYYSEADKNNDVPTQVWVEGYLVEWGKETTFTGGGRVEFVYIVDNYTEESTRNSADALCIASIDYDDENLTSIEDLVAGNKILVRGYIELYKGGTTTTPKPELAYYKDSSNTYHNVYCDYLEKETRTPQQNVELALGKVADTLSYNSAGDHALPESTIPGVTFTWTTTDQTYTISGNKLHVTELPTSDATLTATVTATVEGQTVTNNTKTVTITVRAPVQQEEGSLLLTTDTLFAGIENPSGYASFNGSHTVGTASVTTSQVMISTNDSYPDALQFQGSSSAHGYLSVNGTFTEVVIVLRTSYDLVNPTVTLNGTAVTGTADEGVADGTAGNFTINKYTITYTLTGTGEVKVTNPDTHAMYISSITLTGTPAGGGTVTPDPDEPEVPTGTFTPITAPAAGTDYYMGMNVEGEMYYLTGAEAGYYLATSKNVADACKITIAASGSGWTIKAGSKYIEIEASGTHVNAVFKDTATGAWTWDTTHKTFTWAVTGDNAGDYYLGNYWKTGQSSPYNSVSTSKISNFGNEKQYAALVGTFAEGGTVTPGPTPTHTCQHVCPTCGKCTDANCNDPVCADKCQGHTAQPGANDGSEAHPYTVAELLAASESYTNGEYYPVYVKGVVVLIGTINGSYGLSNVYIADSVDGESLQVYTLNWGGALTKPTTIPAESPLHVGDQVTIHGYAEVWNGALEITSKSKGTDISGGAYPLIMVYTETTQHYCSHACPICGKCLDTDCTETACTTKCGGHTYGTLDAPLTVAQVLELIKNMSNGTVTPQVIYAVGKVNDMGTKKSGNEYWSNFVLADKETATATIGAATINLNSDVVEPTVGDEVIICGHVSNRNGTLTFASNGSIYVNIVKNITKGSVATPELPENAKTASVTISDYATENDWTNDSKTIYSEVILDTNIKATLVGTGNNGKYYSDWRLYHNGNGGITITAENGCTLYSIKITYNRSNNGVLKYGETEVISKTAFLVTGTSVTLLVDNTNTETNGQAKITAIEVVYVPASATVQAPAQVAILPGKEF